MKIRKYFNLVALILLVLAVSAGIAFALSGPHPSTSSGAVVDTWPASAELAAVPEVLSIEGDTIILDLNQGFRTSPADCVLRTAPDGEDLITWCGEPINLTFEPVLTMAPTETATATLEPAATNTPAIEPTEMPPTAIPPTETATSTAFPTIAPTEPPSAGGVFPTFANRPTKIYTVGDSITRCETQNSCYRYPLVNWMVQDGYSIDMVGPNQSRNRAVRFYSTISGDWDYDHGGYAGWQPDFYFQTLVDRGWASEFSPDVVLLHLGINGHLPNHSSDLLSDDGDFLGIVDEFRRVNPEAVIYISKIHETDGVNPAWLSNFNAAVDIFAERHSTDQSPIVVADGYSGFDPDEHTDDGVHLNDAGAILLASRIHAAMFPKGTGQPVPDVTPTVAAQPTAVTNVTPTSAPTATPEPSVNVDPSKCIVGGEGNQFNIAGIGEGWWISHDEFPQDEHEGKYPVVATVSENPADLNHNLTWCFLPNNTGRYYVEMTYQAKTNLEGEVWFQINDGVVTSVRQGDDPNVKVRRVGRQWNGWADDGEWYPAGTRIEFDLSQGVPVKISFFPKLAGFRIYAVRLVWIDAPARPGEPCAVDAYPVGLPECPDLIYPPPQQEG